VGGGLWTAIGLAREGSYTLRYDWRTVARGPLVRNSSWACRESEPAAG